MPELADRLRTDQVVARKSADKDRTLLLGTVLAALKYKEIDLGRLLEDAEVVEVIRKQIKQRQDSIEQYTAGARLDLAAQEDAEMQILLAYLPPEIDPEEIRTAARQAVTDGAVDLGRLMGILMARFKGKADGKVINRIAREALQQG